MAENLLRSHCLLPFETTVRLMLKANRGLWDGHLRRPFEKDLEDVQRRVPSVPKIKDCMGFEPKNDLDGILKHVIDYMSRIRQSDLR